MNDISKPVDSKKVQFNFRPYEVKKNDFSQYTVEKADSEGNKRRYICGVASGPKMDEHGERMTEKCIKSFMDQANSGDVLLYPDVHGIKASDDIGILNKAKILPNGDWFTEFRLYDQSDEVDEKSLQTVEKIWKQLNGLPPYKRPRQKGFSVEGLLDENSIISAQKDEVGNLHNRVMDNVDLDGVILVPRPAYKDSIGHAVCKALNIMTPWKREKLQKDIQSELRKKINEEQLRDQYYRKRWDVNDALEATIEKIMEKPDQDKRDQLELAFDEYKSIMIDLVLQSESLFLKDDEEGMDENPYLVNGVAKASKLEVYKAILHELTKLRNLKTGGIKNGS